MYLDGLFSSPGVELSAEKHTETARLKSLLSLGSLYSSSLMAATLAQLTPVQLPFSSRMRVSGSSLPFSRFMSEVFHQDRSSLPCWVSMDQSV